jgi:hypothetical protein
VIHAVTHEVVEVVRHCVLVDEHIHVEVDVTLVIQAVTQDVVLVVKHCVDVDEQRQVLVDV